MQIRIRNAKTAKLLAALSKIENKPVSKIIDALIEEHERAKKRELDEYKQKKPGI